MKKALVYGPLDLRIVDLPERTPGPGEARARMLVSVLGHHSVRLYEGHLPQDVPSRKHPVTLSYTGVGRVEAVGPGVTSLKPGDLVYPNFYRACGRCDMCRADRMAACREMPLGALNMMIGQHYESALQDYIIFPEERLRPVPPGAALESIALTGSMSVAMNAVHQLDPQPWETVAIVGAGFLGWCAIQLCKLKGARVVAADTLPDRLERARQFGADAVVDAREPPTDPATAGAHAGAEPAPHGGVSEAAERLIAACGEAPLAVIEASGTAEGSRLALEAAGRGARVAAIGASRFGWEQHLMVVKALTVIGIGGAARVQETIGLLAAGKLDVSSAITHRFSFSELKEALECKRNDPHAQLVAVHIP